MGEKKIQKRAQVNTTMLWNIQKNDKSGGKNESSQSNWASGKGGSSQNVGKR